MPAQATTAIAGILGCVVPWAVIAVQTVSSFNGHDKLHTNGMDAIKGKCCGAGEWCSSPGRKYTSGE